MLTIPLDFYAEVCVLPPPALPEGGTLDRALRSRCSTRAFTADPLPLATLSTLLWAGFGINRPASGGRTAPSAHGWQEVDLYAVLREGCFSYDARGHRLMLVKAEDLRPMAGLQEFVADAPLNLVYVADFARMPGAGTKERDFFAGADAGAIAQNVSLACAVLGLGCVVRGLVDRRLLAAAMGLAPSQRIALAQTVGRPQL